MLESLTVLHARRGGKARWVEKTPRHLLMTDTLWRLWPEARVVRIVRDPRDVALSLAGLPFAKESVVGNLVRADQDDRASRQRIEADARAMTLRYEVIVTEPERELRRICAFVGEAWEPAMLDTRATAASVAADHEWWKGSVAGPLTTASVGRWRHEMSADVQRFAGLHLAPFLREHGYEGAVEPRREVAVVPWPTLWARPTSGCCLSWHGSMRSSRGRRQRRRRSCSVDPPLSSSASAGSSIHPRQGAARRVISLAALAGGLLVRRLQGRPVGWTAGRRCGPASHVTRSRCSRRCCCGTGPPGAARGGWRVPPRG